MWWQEVKALLLHLDWIAVFWGCGSWKSAYIKIFHVWPIIVYICFGVYKEMCVYWVKDRQGFTVLKTGELWVE
jgi:hypothetical protein